MTDLVLYILWRWSDVLRARYPQGFPRPWCADNVAMEDGVYHANFYFGWGLLAVDLAAIGAVFSPWAVFALVALPALAFQALWRECVTDGHCTRIRAGTETAEQLLDFKADIITRLAGLIVPAICGLIVIAAVLVRRALA